MSWTRTIEQVGAALAKLGLDEVELYSKQGRTRRLELGPQGKLTTSHRESGWAVRASGRRASLMATGTGSVRPDGPWPEPDGYPTPLPVGSPVPDWREPEDLSAPLVVEAEALGLLEACERELAAELPGTRVLRAVLEDGASEVKISSTRGVDADHRGRAATLFLEVVGPGPGLQRVATLYAEREARQFRAKALVGRIVDHLVLQRDGKPAQRDRGEFLLGPRVGARILMGLMPQLVGPGAPHRARSLLERGNRWASPAVSVIDDGRLPSGLSNAPVDGEGVPTRRLELVEDGIYQRPLLAWWQEKRDPGGFPAVGVTTSPPGCVRRPGWRDVPRLGPSHFFIAPDEQVPAAALLAAVTRGYYFTEVVGAGTFSIEENRFDLPVAGFEVRSGRPAGRISRATLQGRISGLLQGVQHVGRDLVFVPEGHLVGSPSLLVTGIELGP